MRPLLFLFALVLSSVAAYAQTEICNNGLDDDFDGFIDCYDGSCANDPACDGLFLGNDAACEAVPPAFPQFTMALDFASPNETTNHLSRMAIGDLNRDGIPEIVTMNRYTKKLFILNGSDGSVQRETTVTWEPYWEIAIANLDNDNCAEIFFIGYQDPPGPNNGGVYIFGYDCQLNKLWETAQRLRGDPINFGIADFDGDGQEELYAKDEIYDAKTGTRIIASSGPVYNRINGGPVAANIVGDDKLELIAGLNIYQVNLGTRAANSGSLTLLQSRSEYHVRNEYNATSIADYNLDGFLDVLASGSTGNSGANTTVFFWDVQNNTINTFSDPQPALGGNYTNGWVNGTGRLNIADLDGNGAMNASFVSGRFLYALDENFGLLWRVTINEETSGHTGCTLFDFNGDGKAEIVYRDERFIYIIEGSDGSIYSQQACISRTNREYPIVADVDADGSTELCVACGYKDVNAAANFNNLDSSRYSHIRVFKSAAEPWVPARRVWNQHGYFVVNVNDDLTIPTKLQPHQLVFSTGNCTTGPNRPLNKFLNQSPYLNSEGCPTYAAPDIAFHVAPTIIPPTCPSLDFQVSFKITNLGDVALTGNIPVSFYSSDPLQAGAAKLATINVPVNGLNTGDIVSIDNQVVTGNGSAFVYVVLNDAGTSLPTPIVLPNTNFIECDYDNIRFAAINPLPVALTGIQVSPNETCSGSNNGVARAFVPTPSGENTADYNFYWSVGTVAKPIPADYVGAVYSGIPAGTYTVYARHKTANCNSTSAQVVVGTTTAPFPPITINVLSDQTSCSPFNGQLQAVIQGGGAGYSIDWYDIALNSLGISGPTVSNLQAGSYLAVISKGPCNTSVPATVNPPAVPDAQASVLQNVVDCSNPNSGSITADALVSGVVQNPANYTFTWYHYDNTNSTRGSILSATHGTGKTRTGLPVGYYQVEVRENSSQCASTITPIVQVQSILVTPDPPQIVILSSQTSCDPLLPNGVMTANVTIGGVAQNPANFTFEWFKGQNTLPGNKVTTVSDVNGKTVNQVAGGGIPYTVKVTNANNCFAIADLPITENIITPVVTLAQLTPNTVCDPTKASTPYNGSLQATVTFNGINVSLPDNNYTFVWRNPANAIIAVADNKNPVLSGLQDGNSYSVTVRRTDLSCVSAPDTEPVLRSTVLPALVTTSTGSNTCDPAATPDGTATVSITNSVPADAFTFRWHSGNAVVAGNVLLATNNFDQPTAIRLGGVTGSPNPYTVLVTNTRTGCENTATQFVTDESVIPVISFVNVTPNTICAPSTAFNGSLTAQIDNQIGAIADYDFDWYNGNSNAAPVIAGINGVLLGNRDVGFYTVEVENTVTGCRSTAITNQVPDGKVYPAIAFVSNGSYTCDASLTPNGTITANVTNGGTNFSYAWTSVAPAPAVNVANNFTTATLINVGGPTSGNPPNSYQVLVTNTITGCPNTSVGQVADLSQKPTLTLTSAPNGICDMTLLGGPAAFNGSLTVATVVHPALGSSTISYDWFNANAAGVVTGPNNTSSTTILGQLDAGKYGAQVTIDALGCTSDIVIDEVLDTTPTVDIVFDVDPRTSCVANNGRLEVTSPVGATIRYEWYTGSSVVPGNVIAGATNALLGNNLAGGVTSNFTALVTNLANGCQYNEAANVPDGRVTPTLSLSVLQHNTICNIPTIAPDGALLATFANAGTNFTINWIGGVAPSLIAGANGEQFTQLQPGPYSANIINDDTGCQSATDSENILNNVVYPNILATVVPQTSCNAGTPNGSITATDGGSIINRTFEWFTGIGTGGGTMTVDGGDPSNLVDDLLSADYTVRLTINATGCSAVRNDFVNENVTLPAITFSGIGPVTRCDNPDGSATPAVTNASANFSIFYVFTDVNGTAPTTAAAVTGAPTIPFRTTLAPYTGLEPGFVTAVVVNNTTQCVSNPFTGVIPNTTANYNITISGTSPATACGNPNGGVNISVAGGSGTYDFSWHRDSPTNTDINFFNNLPSFVGNPTPGSIAITEDLGSMAAPPDASVTTGMYTVVVTDQTNGCGNYFVTNVPFADGPAVVGTPVHNTNCATPNGAINLSLTPGTLNATGYSILYYTGTSAIAANIVRGENEFDGIDNDGDGFIDAADPDAALDPFSVSALAQGDYFIQVIDNDVLNRPCPLGFQVKINKDAKDPLITVAQLNGNTSCDPGAVAEGEVQLTVSTAVGDLNPKNYFLANVTPLPQGFVLNASPGNQIGTGASGQSTPLISGFLPQDYTFRVQDDVSKCFRDVTLTIPDQQDLPGNIVATPTPETACAPGSNGSVLATLQSGQDEDEFDFTWFENNNGTGVVYADPGVTGAGTDGELLNQGKVAVADWAIGTTGFGSGDRTYYVQATRNANAPSGFGCATPIRQVVIPDAHISPQIALVPTINSFCNAINPGNLGDGSIAITVDANPSAAGVQTSTGGFNYTWTTPNAGLAMPQNGAPNTLTIPQLGNGAYTVNAVNVDNGCITTSATTITPAPFTINLATTNLDQQICNPDGRIDVTQITIDRSVAGLGNISQTSALPLTSVYSFQWFAADANDPNIIIGTPLQDAVGPTNINAQSLVTGNGAGQFATMGAGTYYVVATRLAGAGVATGCSSFPIRVDIEDVHKNPLINLTPFSNTSCLSGPGSGEGIIEIRVSDATPLSYNGGGAFSYNYDWTAGGIPDAPGNDGDGSSADGDDDRITNLLENTAVVPNYSLTVTNPSSGCFSTASTTILKNATPIFVQNVIPTDQISCAPNGDGSLNVTAVTLNDRQGNVETFNAISATSPISNFEFEWRRGVTGPQTTPGTTLNVGTYVQGNFGGVPIGAGTYTVIARRIVAPSANDVGRGCASAPFTVAIQDKRLFPVVSLTPFANTACDPLFAEGSIEVRVADATLVAGPHTFSYAWSGGNPTAIAPSAANNGDGVANGDNDMPTGLLHGDYNMTVRNNQSLCTSIASTTLFRNSTPIIIPLATTTPQILCSADGSIQVSSVAVTDRNNNTFAAPFADFEFDWSHTTLTPVVATTIGANPGGTSLNNINYPLIERGQYFVVARRVAGTLGRGCVSAPYHATIDDLRVFPELTFIQQANSSCTNLSPNGELVASAREISGVNTGPYTFSWAMNPGTVSPASVQTDNANTSTLANALDGNYLVTATNTLTSCPVTSPVTLVLDQSLSTPNIIQVTTVDPLDCNPTGQAAVTRITLGSTTQSILFPPNVPPNNEISGAGLNIFEYEWYQGSVTAGNQLPIGGPVFTTTPTITSLLTGTYFVVVRDPATDCRSGAREVIINPDDIVLPDLLVTQTALQISCRPGIGSAELSVTADGQTDTNPNYAFTWFGNDSTTPPSIGTASTLSDITAGTYSVTVHDNTTNCSISDSYIIEDDTQEFTPVISMASQPRTLCVGTDGEIFARVLNLSPLYPYPYNANTFTADLYFGTTVKASPDMSAIPNTVGFIGNFSQNNLNEGFYTVRVTDNNTGCFTVATEEIKDARLFPIVVVQEIAPVTNCDPARPNGVAQVTANNTFVGFTFDWYEGATASGTPVYSGAEFGELKVKPQQYVVRATDNTSGCFTDVATDIENGTVLPPAAIIEVLSHVTSCVSDNGSLMAYVGPDKNTASYIFHWYDGAVENPPADNIGETYNDLAIGFYSVTATSVITGCKSPLTTAEILNEQQIPNFEFVIQNTTCDKNDGFATLIMISDVPIERIEWSNGAGPFLTGPNFTDAAAGFYEVTATTFLGCQLTKQLEIRPDIRPYNGISRNGDGKNEIFQIDCIQNFPTNLVKVFNRAGTLVYEAEGYDNSSTFFDGKSNRGISPMGVNLPDGTYFYIVDKRDGTKPVAGYLEIVN